MGFLAPVFAAFALLGGVPILIHLVGRSRARVRKLPTLILLQASQLRVAQYTRLRHLALLLLRILVLAAIPLALAKPYFEARSDLPARVGVAQSAVLVLDDSLSMRYQLGDDGRSSKDTLFARAKRRAVRLIDALPPTAEVALVLGASGGVSPVAELTSDRARLYSAIAALQPSLRSADLGGALKRAAQILQTVRRAQRHVYILTDAAGHALPEDLLPPSELEVSVVDVSDGKPLPNVALVDVLTESAPSLGARAIRVSAEVANFGDMPVKELQLTLWVDGRPVAKGLLDVAARSHATKRFFHLLRPPVEAAGDRPTPEEALRQLGLHHISVGLSQDRLTDDDTRHAKVEVQRSLRVLILDGDPRTLRREDEIYYLEMALHPGEREESAFQVTAATLEEAGATLSDYDAVLLCNAKAADLSRRQLLTALRDYVQAGGGLFIAVGDNADVEAYNSTLAELLPQPLAVVKTTGRIGRGREAAASEETSSDIGEHLGHMDRRHPLLSPFLVGRASESLLSARFGRYVLLRPTPKSSADATVILSYESGAPALVEKGIGRGKVLLFTSTIDRDWNDLAIQPAFLPLMHQLVRYLARAPARAAEPSTLIGQPREIKLESGDTRLEITLPSGKKRLFERLAGRVSLSFVDTIEPGLYRVAGAPDSGVWRPRPAEFFIVNVDPAESDLQHAPPARITALERPLHHEVETGAAPRRRVELWHYLGLLLLVGLLVEALLLRKR